jgi:hypothetical protein
MNEAQRLAIAAAAKARWAEKAEPEVVEPEVREPEIRVKTLILPSTRMAGRWMCDEFIDRVTYELRPVRFRVQDGALARTMFAAKGGLRIQFIR